jgi:hypothetical protein
MQLGMLGRLLKHRQGLVEVLSRNLPECTEENREEPVCVAIFTPRGPVGLKAAFLGVWKSEMYSLEYLKTNQNLK